MVEQVHGDHGDQSDQGNGETVEPRQASLIDAVLPLLVLIGLIAGALALFGLDALDGPVQVALLLACMVVCVLALKNGNTWERIQACGQSALGSITSAVFILLAVGALIATWNMSGTIPTLVSYGLHVMSPSWFYVTTALVCGLVAVCIGSSWTTAATIGVGLVGVATLVGASPCSPPPSA